MKITICTTPIRQVPSDYPPFGSMAVIQSLRKSGYDPYFYDIDTFRPSFEEVLQFFEEQSPDAVGISAVVSTAYRYTKRLALGIRQVSPTTKIVVGGNLAASAEILLRFCSVDACVVGEGEKIMVNLMEYYKTHPDQDDFIALRKIKGLTYLDGSGDLVFTGYEDAIPATEFPMPDWSILDKYSKVENYFTNPINRYDFAQDARTHEPHRMGKTLGTVPTAKGCVAKCTFCHRWDRGYRHWDVDQIIAHIKFLINEYNVGFIQFGDENFGSDRAKLDDLIEQMKPLDILYKVAGVRCRSVNPDVLRRLYDSGCVAMYYGMETGSSKILQIMEKNTELQQNIDAARWTYDAGIYTIYQLVLAMPGEDHQTIRETTEFIKQVTEFLPDPPHMRLSVNYIQALPGTPVYEYARNTGLIKHSLEDEEKYLISVSDIDAVDDSKSLNFTGYDYLTMQTWRPKLVFDAEANWYRKRGWDAKGVYIAGPDSSNINSDQEAAKPETAEEYSKGGYFNIGHVVIRHPRFYRALSSPLLFPLRMGYPLAYVLLHDLRIFTKRQLLGHMWSHLVGKIKRGPRLRDFRSLRKIMRDRGIAADTTSAENSIPLREGR